MAAVYLSAWNSSNNSRFCLYKYGGYMKEILILSCFFAIMFLAFYFVYLIAKHDREKNKLK